MLLSLLMFVQVNPIAWGVNQTDFIIHGVWPEYRNGTWPQYCCHTPLCKFNMTKINTLIPNLTEWWTDFDNPRKLWSHEWTKHGSCARNMTEYDYFRSGLLWRKKHPMARILEAANLIRGVKYLTSKFISQLYAILNVRSIITCTEQLLTQVELCYWNMTLGDCPTSIENRCSDKIYY